MIEFNLQQGAGAEERFEGFEDGEGKVSLTQLWEVVVRTKRLPEGLDASLLYHGVCDRLRAPEREVRLHALRVLQDLIPATNQHCLDKLMRPLLPELVENVGHEAPALRKGAIDALRKYLQHTDECDRLLVELVLAAEENSVVAATPFLITSEITDCTARKVVDQLWQDLNSPLFNQEVIAKSLARIRYILGEERFKSLLGRQRFEELVKICDNYGIPIDYSDGDSSSEKAVWTMDELIEDRVILETEITLKTGPAITMKIHEESRPGSIMDMICSDEESRKDEEFYGSPKKTPRKVRFGGESVKMRTPETDSNHGSQDCQEEIRITVTDAVSIETRKSLIPVRITSLPNSPKKSLLPMAKKPRLHKSAPDLRTGRSRIPIFKKSGTSGKSTDSSTLKEGQTKRLSVHRKDADSKTSPKRREMYSPVPVHREIEVFHNLTRSPERKRRSPVDFDIKKIDEEEHISFQVCTDGAASKTDSSITPTSEPQKTVLAHVLALPAPKSNSEEDQPNSYGSFQICSESASKSDATKLQIAPPEGQRTRSSTPNNATLASSKMSEPTKTTLSSPEPSKILALPAPEDVNRNTNTTYNSFKVCEEKTKCEKDESYDSFQVYQTPNAIEPSNPENEAKPQKEEFNSFQVESEEANMNQSYPNYSQNGTPSQSTKSNGFNFHQLSSLSAEGNLWSNSEALDNLIKMLKQPSTFETLEAPPSALLFEALFACKNFDKIHFLVDDALVLLIKGLRKDVLEQCLSRLAVGICKIGAPSGVSLAMMITKVLPAVKLQHEIMEKCFVHRLREGALQTLLAFARLLPRNELLVPKMTEFTAAALRDRRRKVRHAALEMLATLAALSSNTEVLDMVTRVTSNFPEQQYLLKVVRTRLSRKQLPAVDINGTVRYSTPRDQTEVEWLSGSSGNGSSPPSSSASSSNHSVNYWKYHSRQDGEQLDGLDLSNQDDLIQNGQQIWAIDANSFAKNTSGRRNGDRVPPAAAVLRPMYVLRPEAAVVHARRKYDRGRSFSPPKRQQQTQMEKQEVMQRRRTLTRQESIEDEGEYGEDQGVDDKVESTGHFKYHRRFQKSFSSEQLYEDKRAKKDQYFSLSSRSSTTSTESTRSGIWNRDMRSGIPIPISSDIKLRLRTNNASTNMGASAGPVIAHRSILTSPVTPVRIFQPSPSHHRHPDTPAPSRLPPHPLSTSGSSESSSGYGTPPPNHNRSQQAFVRLDGDGGNEDKNNNGDGRSAEGEAGADTCSETSTKRSDATVVSFADGELGVGQRTLTPSSAELSDVTEEAQYSNEAGRDQNDNLQDRQESVGSYSTESFKQFPFGSRIPQITDGTRSKSKSVVDLHQSFLPDIGVRKNTNSAPLLKDLAISSNKESELGVHEYDSKSPSSSSIKLVTEEMEPPALHLLDVNGSHSEATSGRKLTRRLTRSQSRRSIKSTPRSIQESAPTSSRSTAKPKELLQQCLAQLNNPEWEVMLQGLKNLSKLARNHPDIVEVQIHTICANLARHIKNLRSQVARAACHTASELFETCKRSLEMELEEIAGPLLHRTADTNKFLRADANAALDVMCDHMPTSRVISVVTAKGCQHQNAIVRSAAMRLIDDIVRRVGADRVFQLPKEVRDRLLVSGANSLTDGSLETRNFGKSMISQLITHHHFQKSLVDAVPQSTLRHIAKTLSAIKSSCT
ncbi:unnamed protein product [Acanthoscelides obtectus]|uniref:TOG domain-containing protein n=1 Tax=Acanthoscelides obtectus TaxID=200917 RepID=A0A9P0PSU5_ACAOB|nr:unnamed protein product [Acanthoscelides obtectus]CAK1679209.1 TOG array regulator of axonemal microtubules protein 1 [Acanthoscelides obtectus]